MPVKRYRPKSSTIEAIQRTESNNDEIKEFAGKEFRTDRGGAVFIGDYSAYHRLEVGDWVVKFSTGAFYVLGDRHMQRRYEEDVWMDSQEASSQEAL